MAAADTIDGDEPMAAAPPIDMDELMAAAPPIDMEEEWKMIQAALDKLDASFSATPPQESLPTSDEYMLLYSKVYNMCIRQNQDLQIEVYTRYKAMFEEYIKTKVWPSLKEKDGEVLLRELVTRWTNHKVLIRWFAFIFSYLKRYFVARVGVPSLEKTAIIIFRDLVYQETKGKARDAIISLVNQEREGELIDGVLLKSAVEVFIEIDPEKKFYKEDFEAAFVEDAAAYYSRKASGWIKKASYSEYMSKVNECLKRETDIVSHYLDSITEQILLEKVKHELLEVHKSRLFVMELSA